MKRFLILALALATANIIDACMGMSRDRNARIEFTGQSNILIWDDKRQIEHFIRSAKFNSSVKEFDFVAPTPSVPEVAVAKQSAFDFLRLLTAPPMRQSGGFGGGGAGGAPKSGGVDVYQETEVGNFHVVTLKATDTDALKKWFAENQYTVSNTQDDWFKFYIQKGWYLTAFRVVSDRKDLKTEAIRMSFKTSVLYNPYYVPKENWFKGSRLELFIVSRYQMRGFIGDNRWNQEPEGRMRMDAKDSSILARDLNLKATDVPAGVTAFRYVDNGFAYGAKDDLFFYPKP